MVEYIVRNTEMLKNTIVVHRGHFGGYLLIHRGLLIEIFEEPGLLDL